MSPEIIEVKVAKLEQRCEGFEKTLVRLQDMPEEIREIIKEELHGCRELQSARCERKFSAPVEGVTYKAIGAVSAGAATFIYALLEGIQWAHKSGFFK